MKTMEQKAQAYDEAVTKSIEFWTLCKKCGAKDTADFLESIFPELIESEDEKIRKWIIDDIRYNMDNDPLNNLEYKKKAEKAIAWLEKQSKPKPTWSEEDEHRAKDTIYFLDTAKKHYASTVELDACIFWIKSLRERVQVTKGKLTPEAVKEEKIDNENKVESKFKIGDWVVFNNNHESIYQIEKKENFQYIIRHILGGSMPLSFSREDMIRLWTIQDAKPGDVLFHSDSASNGIFIFKEILQCGNIQKVQCYCDYDSEDGFCLGEKHTCCWADSKILHPATKEQYNKLFTKMKEAGYEWNTEKKELSKVEEEINDEDYGVDGLWHAQRILEKTFGDVDGYQSDDGILEHKCAISAVKKLYEQKPSWSEDDEQKFRDVIRLIEQGAPVQSMRDHYINWLKSLKERYTWKPSDEQIKAVKRASGGSRAIAGNDYLIMESLYNDLKKL